MRKFILASSLLVGLAAPLAAAAPAATPAIGDLTTRKDVQCFLLFASAVGNAKDEAAAKPASIGLSYYLGKITRGAPAIDLVAAVKQESKALQAADPQKAGAACEQELTRRLGDVDKLGQALSTGR